MKKTKLTKRIMATVVSIIMVMVFLPVSTVIAAENASVTVEAICETYSGTVIGGGSYNAGDTVTLTATPAEDMLFMYWLDATAQLDEKPAEEDLKAAIVSYDAEYTFTATEDVTLEAVFFVETTIPIFPVLIAGTDEESLLAAEWVNTEGDFGTVIPGTEPIALPGEVIEDIVTIGEKQYQFAGFILFGYDEATDTETVELKEAMTIGAMPLYNSAEYWEWFVPISDGVYVAYMEYTPEEDEPQEPTDPGTPEDPQEPTDPETPDEPEVPTSPQTGDNNHIALWVALLFVSGGAVITLTVVDRKRKAVKR